MQNEQGNDGEFSETLCSAEDSPKKSIEKELLPRFHAQRLLGTGTSGSVIQCYDTETNQIVAVKILHGEAALDEESVVRFQNEISFTQKIDHPNVVGILDSGKTQSGTPFVAMELLSGGSLKEKLAQAPDKQIPFREAVEMLLQISEGVSALHAQGLIHRDIKPGNIIFTENGIPKVTDLGLARSMKSDFSLTKTGVCLGTPYYMSPEQVRCESVTPASDIYSLSILAYELVMGHRPYEEDNWFALAKRHCADPIPELAVKDAGVPCWFEAFVKKAGAKIPSQRYQSAAEFSDVLKQKLREADTERTSVGQVIHFVKPNGVLCTYLRNRGISRRRSAAYLLGTTLTIFGLAYLSYQL
jgi:serine/threonine-protein kinase